MPEVTAVDQQLEDGQLIRTIEGPAAKVSSLIANQEAEDASSRQPDAANGNQPDKMTLTLRQGDRMLAVTGPSKVLGNLMISRGACGGDTRLRGTVNGGRQMKIISPPSAQSPTEG